ncbi:MAG: flavin reductase family protein [Ruminococcaceae bacterium]|nr:flavin reductase family protein [Oscillospiraceae bacterium]
MFKEITAKEIKQNLISAIADEWMLISAGDQNGYNMMTASWGFMGEMWGKDTAIAMIRPQRYTMEFVEKSDYFALSFYGDKKDIHKVCGSLSGRDVNKTEMTGLSPIFEDNTVYFKEARLVLICKKNYMQPLEKECFIDKDSLKWYKENDFHNMIFGEIKKVLVKE